MYNLKSLFNKNPVQISGTVLAIVNFCIIMDWLEMSTEAVAGLNVLMGSLLGLFVTSTTVNSAKLEELDNGK